MKRMSYVELAKQEFSVVFGRAANMATDDADWIKQYAQILKTGFKSNRESHEVPSLR
jgi:hypothetical protein